jgi:hypothetical protein
MERDARQIHADKPVSPGSIAIGVVIGRTSEFFDFFVYGLASVLVFPQLVFPFAPDRLTATLYSFAIFSLAFLARPVGSVVFMTIDRLVRSRHKAHDRAVPAGRIDGVYRFLARL